MIYPWLSWPREGNRGKAVTRHLKTVKRFVIKTIYKGLLFSSTHLNLMLVSQAKSQIFR